MAKMEWPPTKAELVSWVEEGEGWSIGPAPRDTVEEASNLYDLLSIIGDYDNRQAHDDWRLNSSLDRLISTLAFSAWGGDSIESREKAAAYIDQNQGIYENAVNVARKRDVSFECYMRISEHVTNVIAHHFAGRACDDDAAHAIAYCAIWQINNANKQPAD